MLDFLSKWFGTRILGVWWFAGYLDSHHHNFYFLLCIVVEVWINNIKCQVHHIEAAPISFCLTTSCKSRINNVKGICCPL